METNSVSRRYETRGNAKAKEPVAKSRVDWRLTKSQRLLDESEEEEEEEEEDISSASGKDCETSSEGDLNEEKSEDVAIPNTGQNEAVLHTCGLPGAGPGEDNPGVDHTEEENISIRKRKRSHTWVIVDSDDSDDSDIVRKVFSKRLIDEEDAPAEQEQQKSFEEEERTRKQTRQKKLQELSRRRSLGTSNFSEFHEDSEDDEIIHSALTPTEGSDPSECDSMKDFIVDEEEKEETEEEEEEESHLQRGKGSTLLEKHIPCLSRVDHFVHFQRVIKAFLINAFDDSFLASLYAGKRQKRYAQEMLTSLHYLDDRFIQPRLDNLIARSRWKERYKDRVDSYPDVQIVFERAVMRSCEACELQRYCTVKVILSGNLYSSETLEADNFMFQDKQVLKVGAVCGNRTQVYHSLKHFKYKLYQNCCDVMKTKGFGDEPVKDSVERAFRQLDDDGWIRKQYTGLEDCMDNADYFHEEKID